MTISQKAEVIWNGPMKEGSGNISVESGVFKKLPYSYNTRFENVKGTNPEELIAAAHASCFSMALSGAFGNNGFEVKKIKTVATVSLDKKAEQWTISSSHLDVEANVLEINDETFQKIATEAKLGCPVSRLLKAEISLSAKLNHELL